MKKILPLLLTLGIGGIFGLTWNSGAIHPSDTKVYYYSGEAGSYPAITVYSDYIKLGDTKIEVRSENPNNRINVYIDEPYPPSIKLRIEPDMSDNIYVTICNRIYGNEIWNVRVVNSVVRLEAKDNCILIDFYGKADTDHTVEILSKYTPPVSVGPTVPTDVIVTVAILAAIAGATYFLCIR